MPNAVPGRDFQPDVPEPENADAESEAEGASGTKANKSKAREGAAGAKQLTRKEKARRYQSRMARRFPDGPEAKAKAAAEPKMPAALKQKIEFGRDYDRWNQAFGWVVTQMRQRLRRQKTWKGERLAAEFFAAYDTLAWTEVECKWLAAWLNFLAKNKSLVREPKFASDKVMVEALGVRSKADCAFDQIDALDTYDTVMPPLTQSQPPAQESARPTETGQVTDTEAPTLFPMPMSQTRSEEAVIMSLPPTPRMMPFKFRALQAESAQAFWRAYWNSDDLVELAGKARDFAGDREAVAEVRNFGAEAIRFLDETMTKLGVTLS